MNAIHKVAIPIALAALLTVPAACPADVDYETVVMAQGAVAYYRLNDTGSSAVDQVSGFNASYGIGTTPGQTNAPQPLAFGGFGSGNTSALFDAGHAGSAILLPQSSLAMTSAAGSVSLWMNTTPDQADSSTGMIFYGSNSTTGDGFGGQNELHLHLATDGKLGMFIRGSGSNTQFILNTASDAGIRDGQWHHLCMTWDIAGKADLYLDGESILSGDHDANSFGLSSLLRLGKPSASGAHRQYGGLMDEVALYNTALTDVQAHDQYHAAAYHYDASQFVLQPTSNPAPGVPATDLMLQVEAENFTTRSTTNADTWRIVDGTAASGTVGSGEDVGAGGKFSNAQGDQYMQVVPDTGDSYASNAGVNAGPYLDYRIEITEAGQYLLSVRWDGFPGGTSDSMYAQIVGLGDGNGGAVADWYRFSHNADRDFATTAWENQAGFERIDAGGNNQAALWYLPAGWHTLRFTPREDGVAIDAFRLQRVVPTPSAFVLGTLGLGLVGWMKKRKQ